MTAKQIIIFDYGYQAGMEVYIKKKNPSCKVFLFFWNIINDKQKNHILFTDKDAIYSTDKDCCEKYHFKYNHIFYTRDYYQEYSPKYRNRLFFLGTDKGRAPYIHELKKILEKSGLMCDIRVITSSKDPAYKKALSDILTENSLCYEEYFKELEHCGILLDINQIGQRALTMRVMEAIFLSKKLITNNRDILQYDFYYENNIFLLPEQLSELSVESLKTFLDKPFRPYSKTTLNQYDFSHWKKQFT